jgi:serine-type D-Ala-D-Ala carboxypeptidase/endopeptidase (penicillin-binding protein 4)
MSGPGVGRRALIAGAAALLATPALVRAAGGAEPVEAILAASGLGPVTGFALLDPASGQTIEAHAPGVARPPASVAKVVTALWALDALGPGYRFATRLLASGPVQGGTLSGDLVLAGGGDPVFDTDALRAMVGDLRRQGLERVAGRVLVADGALPAIAGIDDGQPAEAAYNPAISGMNLNFNRVFLAWKAGGAGLAFSAPGQHGAVALSGFRAEAVARGLPRHRLGDGVEIWSLPREGLRRAGSAWLPVRMPAAHAGEVLAGLGAEAGLALPAPQTVATGAATAPGAVMALSQSPPLARLMRDMLGYSTNLTAEVAGLRASQARGLAPDGLASSATAMTAWARARFGLSGARFVDHSGLGAASRITPAELVAVLRQAGPLGLPGLMKERPILDAARKPVAIGGVRVLSKTGTLDFVSALAGYLEGPRPLVFAILAADPGRRAGIRPGERAKPPGAAGWANRARAQEQALLRRWAGLYAV